MYSLKLVSLRFVGSLALQTTTLTVVFSGFSYMNDGEYVCRLYLAYDQNDNDASSTVSACSSVLLQQ